MIIFLYSVSQLIFVMDTTFVLCEVGMKFLCIIYINVSLLRDNKEICAVRRSFSYVAGIKKAMWLR